MRPCIIGIDPGKNGGYGIIDAQGNYVDCGSQDAFMHNRGVPNSQIAQVFIEHQQVRHEDKKAELFNLQHLFINYGEWRGILGAYGLNYETVEPWVWQSHFGLTFPAGFRRTNRGQLKIIKSDMILTLARTLFPGAGLNKRKDDGKAAGLLIAEFGRQRNHQELLGLMEHK